MKVAQIRFRNDTHDLNILVGEQEWEINEEDTENCIKVAYRAQSQWQNGQDTIGRTSEIEVKYQYSCIDDNRNLQYNVTIDNPPGNGSLSISMSIASMNMKSGCQWSGESTAHYFERAVLTLWSGDGKEYSVFKVTDKGYVETNSEELEVMTEVEDEIVNSTASLEVNMALPSDTRSASIGGSLTIFDELMEEFKEATEFVIDHIYYFAAGAAVLVVIIIGGLTLVSRKKTDTDGKELELGSNKYYKGPQ
jgi:hypothetical protein